MKPGFILTVTVYILALVSCSSRQSKETNAFLVDEKLAQPALNKLTITSHGGYESNGTFEFDDLNVACLQRNDTLLIFNGEGGFTGNSLKIIVSGNSYTIGVSRYSCTYQYGFTPVAQRLILNQSGFHIGDSIMGKLYFKGFHIVDSVKHRVDTAEVKGRFRYKIYNRDTDIDNLRSISNYNRFLKESRNRPDTLTSLWLGKSGIKQLPAELKRFKNLKELNLDYNNLSGADLSELAKFEQLELLNLKNCNLRKIPSVVYKLKNLKDLTITLNDLTSLPDSLFEMKNLRSLSIEGKNLKDLPDAIARLQKLEELDLSVTRIKKFPNAILKLKKLRVIDPPDSMDYFPPALAKCLLEWGTYDGIKNVNEFKHLLRN